LRYANLFFFHTSLATFCSKSSGNRARSYLVPHRRELLSSFWQRTPIPRTACGCNCVCRVWTRVNGPTARNRLHESCQ